MDNDASIRSNPASGYTGFSTYKKFSHFFLVEGLLYLPHNFVSNLSITF